MTDDRRRARVRLALGPLCIIALAIVTMVVFHCGIVVRDARYEHIAAPWQFLTRHLELWDDTRGPGVPLQYFSPVVGSLQSLMAWLGTPAWLIGRLTLALYLSIAGVGAWYLWRRLWPERSGWAVMAGLLYAFNPYTSQAIIPSGLFLPVALLPWLVAFTLDGVRRGTAEGWRPAVRSGALCALAVFSVGMLNTASLLLVLIPVVGFGVLLVFERVGSWRGLLRFGLPATVLTGLVSAPMLIVLALSSPVISRNLGTTELPETVALSSSSFESWRGLGKWLSYFRWGGSLESPSASAYMTRPAVIVATFVATGLAIIALGWKRMPLRRTWGVLLATSVLFMVGAHSPKQSPVGRAFRWVFDGVGGAAAFRSTFKGGPIAVLATAILATAGTIVIVGWIATRVDSIGTRRLVVGAVGVVVLVSLTTSAYPFLRGSRLGDNLSVAEVPDYWNEAFEFFESVPASDRVLVLPAASRGRYVWGTINDTLFDARMTPQVLMASSIPSTTGELADATVAFDRLLTDLTLDPAAIAPVLRWLGVRWVLLQKDLDQFAYGMPLDPLGEFRTAPGLTLDAQFGVDAEGYPLLEVLSVDDPAPAAALSVGPPMIVSGGPDSLYALAANGLLGDRPTTFLPDLDDARVAQLVAAGAPVVVTDGSRRVASRVADSRLATSELLTADADPLRPILVLDPTDTATQTVAVFDDAVREFTNRAGNSVDSWSYETSAAQAFDGDDATAWWVSTGTGPAEGASVGVDLAQPETIRELVITRSALGDAFVTSAKATFIAPDGSSTSVDLTFDGPVVRVPVDEIASTVTLEITGTNGVFGRFGFSSIDLIGDDGPLDLVEWTRVPIDANRAGSGVTPTFAFARSEHEIGAVRIRREFDVPAASEYRVGGRISLPYTADGATIDPSCSSWFDIDGAQIPARIVGFDPVTHYADLVGCAPVPLSAGVHRIGVIGNPLVTIDSVLLVPTGQDDANTMVDVDARGSASTHSYDVPGSAGWLTTLVPAHAGWKFHIDGRSSELLVMNAEMGWWVSAGDPAVATLRFGPQFAYRIAMVIAAIALLFCIGVQFWRRRARA